MSIDRRAVWAAARSVLQGFTVASVIAAIVFVLAGDHDGAQIALGFAIYGKLSLLYDRIMFPDKWRP